MKKAVLFDLDGTLANTLDDLADASNAVLERHGFSIHPLDAYRRFVGNGAANLLKTASGTSDPSCVNALLSDFLTEYDSRLLCKTRPYDGVIDTLEHLLDSGITVAVVTNKPHEQAVRLVSHLFGDRISLVYGGCARYPKKPDPCCVYLALQELGVTAAECVFVGDSDVDVYTAHNTGMPCIGCAFGFRGEEELKTAGADDIVYSFAELQKNRLIFE